MRAGQARPRPGSRRSIWRTRPRRSPSIRNTRNTRSTRRIRRTLSPSRSPTTGAPTARPMARRRWWETGERSIEDEAAAFRAAGLAFELDQQLFDANDVVIFRGDLRLNERRVPAEVRYPPAYADDEPVVVYAPALPVGRHRSRDGLLCLDHPVLGETSGMAGAEAVQRAERLWWLWENDREQLGE